MTRLKTTICAILTFLLLDALWLGVVGTRFYVNEMGSLMHMSDGRIMPIWPAAIVVYFALILGILVFVIPKCNGHATTALLWGGIFGFVTYATYDFTCMAILVQWSLKISIIDTLWGIVLCALTSYAAILAPQLYNRWST